jgi:hypothetical protein
LATKYSSTQMPIMASTATTRAMTSVLSDIF